MAKLTASDGEAGEKFGWSVSISGDTAVIGAYLDDDNGLFSGSAYVFVKPPGGWVTTNQENVKLDPSSQLDFFGTSVAISIDTAVVGSPNDDLKGSAYIFERDAGGADLWGQTAKLTASDGVSGDEFGFSVSIRGDGVFVGAYKNDDAGSTSGSAYTFLKPSTGWQNGNEDDIITASDAAAGDEFGFFVSISGDLAIVGAHLDDDDDDGDDSGSAYVFDGVCPCPWDLDGDGGVGVADLLGLLAAWGTDPVGPPDFDDNGDVGVSDLLVLLANWGLCPCEEGTPPLSLADELADACLTQDDWDDFEDVMTDPQSSQEDKDRYYCWMVHYLDHCNKCTCTHIPTCPSPDPFS